MRKQKERNGGVKRRQSEQQSSTSILAHVKSGCYEQKKKNLIELGYDTGEMNEALNFLTYHDIMKADFGYLCSSTQNIPLCQRHRDFCALLDDDIIMANIKKLSIETLKRYSIRNRSQLARLFIYKLKFVWILTAKTWIKQKIWKR